MGSIRHEIPPRIEHAGPTPRFLKNAGCFISTVHSDRVESPLTIGKERKARAEARSEKVVACEDTRNVARVTVLKIAVRSISMNALTA
jgi:hypothetical protein